MSIMTSSFDDVFSCGQKIHLIWIKSKPRGWTSSKHCGRRKACNRHKQDFMVIEGVRSKEQYCLNYSNWRTNLSQRASVCRSIL